MKYLRTQRLALLTLFAALPLWSCGSDTAPTPTAPPCDDECKDEIALKAIRETMKLAFNLTFQGKPVGEYTLVAPCPLGGGVGLRGTATSNALQGTTEVDITYAFQDCAYFFKDDDPEDNYDIVLSGIFHQKGILAVQPTTPSAVNIEGTDVKLEGTVYDPPIPYSAACKVMIGQNGSVISGTICDRKATTGL